MDRWQPGDILACYGADLVSQVIRWGTRYPLDLWSCWSPPSHVAIICEHEGRMVLVESTTMCPRPCLITRVNVSGAQVHDPDSRIADYVKSGGHVDQYRLVGINQLTSQEELELSWWLIHYFVARRACYDKGGALLSGLKVLRLLNLMPNGDLEQLFCSEMLAAVLMRLCRLKKDNPTFYNPGRLIQELLRTGTYKRIRQQVRPLMLFEGQETEARDAA